MPSLGFLSHNKAEVDNNAEEVKGLRSKIHHGEMKQLMVTFSKNVIEEFEESSL